mmetsp:Transcript_6160/g.11821  ORF Transcript_6160/g.11821 Transcript_6160/m.11821 type:complete len:429 (+) Transcript_6160:76-1362(+)
MDVRISTLSGYLCTIAAKGDWRLADLHEALEHETGKPVHAQRLFCGGDELNAWCCPLSTLLGGTLGTVDVTLVTMPAPWCRITGFRFRGTTIVVRQQTIEEAKEQCASLENCHCFSLESEVSGLTSIYFEGCVSKDTFQHCPSRTWTNFLRLDSNDDRNIVLDAIIQSWLDPLQLQSASDEIRSDRALILASVAKDGSRLQYASTNLRSDPEIVRAAFGQTSCALQFAAPMLLDDYHFCMSLVKENGRALKHVSRRLLQDPDFGSFVLQQNGEFLKDLDYTLRNQQAFVLSAVKQCGSALQHASKELLSDGTFVHIAVSENKAALRYVPETMWKDSWQSLGMAATRGARSRAVAPFKAIIKPSTGPHATILRHPEAVVAMELSNPHKATEVRFDVQASSPKGMSSCSEPIRVWQNAAQTELIDLSSLD